jgi:hypothetical protein
MFTFTSKILVLEHGKRMVLARECFFPYSAIQLFQLRLSPSKAKSRIRARKACWESLKNSLIFLAILIKPFALVFDFSAGFARGH